MRALDLPLVLVLSCLTILLVFFAIGAPAFAEPADADTTARKRSGWVFFPYLFYTPETKIAAGAGGGYFFREPGSCVESRPSTILGDFMYTQNRQLALAVQPDIYWRDERYHLRAELGYQRFPDKFYGIGNNTPKDLEEDFTPEEIEIILKIQVRLLRGFFVGPLYEYYNGKLAEVEDQGLLAQKTIPGSAGALVSGAGLAVSWDTRDNIYFPSKGSYFRFSASLFAAQLGGQHDFERYVADLRKYVTVYPSHTLALQVYGRSTNGDVPFQRLSELGGSWLMRGYYQGRYRDHELFALQSEYRMPAWRRFGLVAFAGLGDVARKISGFRWKDTKTSAGFGVRYLLIPEEKMNLRFDFGFGQDTSGFYVAVTEAF